MAEFTIKDVTVKDRILLHLSRFSNVLPGQEYNVPFDLTQDGIAMVVGITRSHASLDLKKLGESGMVTFWQAHQKGVRSRRLVYTATPAGLEKASTSRTRLEKEGINIDTILDMRKCDPMTKWNALSPEDREVFGKVCVLRVPVSRDIFPPTPTGTLPTDILGMTSIPEDVSRVYLEKAPPEDVRRWNSWAADWWLEQGNIQERLHHLIAAGRQLEASKFVIRHIEEFIVNPNEDLLEQLNKLETSPSTEEDVTWLRSQVASSLGNLEEMKKCSKQIGRFKSPVKQIIDAQICMLREDYDGAYDLAAGAYDDLHTPLSAVLMAKACLRQGDLEEADQLAVEACDAMHSIGDAKDIDEILKVRAEIAYMKGNTEEACALLGKAKAAAPDYKKDLIQNLVNSIQKQKTDIRFL